jgi:hypothetical protein
MQSFKYIFMTNMQSFKHILLITCNVFNFETFYFNS